jgi:hypothetical protein
MNLTALSAAASLLLLSACADVSTVENARYRMTTLRDGGLGTRNVGTVIEDKEAGKVIGVFANSLPSVTEGLAGAAIGAVGTAGAGVAIGAGVKAVKIPGTVVNLP